MINFIVGIIIGALASFVYFSVTGSNLNLLPKKKP